MTRIELFTIVRGAAHVRLLGEDHDLGAGDTLVVPANETFELSNPGSEPFEAIVVLLAGGRAAMPGTDPFVPPWSA